MDELEHHRLTYIGTIRKNRTNIPKPFQKTKLLERGDYVALQQKKHPHRVIAKVDYT